MIIELCYVTIAVFLADIISAADWPVFKNADAQKKLIFSLNICKSFSYVVDCLNSPGLL